MGELVQRLCMSFRRKSILFDPPIIIDYFCNDDGCLTYIGEDKARGITSWDHGHLNLLASNYFVRDVLKKTILD